MPDRPKLQGRRTSGLNSLAHHRLFLISEAYCSTSIDSWITGRMLRNAAGETRLFINSKCKELIEDFEQVSYKADSMQIDKEKDRRRTHLSDALGYLLWQEFRHMGAAGERCSRLF